MSYAIALNIAEREEPSSRFDRAVPWMASITFHLGVGLLVLFASWFLIRSIKPTLFDVVRRWSPTDNWDMTTQEFVMNPYDANNGLDVAQDRIKEIPRSDGWMQAVVTNTGNNFLSGTSGSDAMDAIFRSNGDGIGSTGANRNGDGGSIAPYGTPGGGVMPQPTFICCFLSNTIKVVYIIDHSGSMLDNFDYVCHEVSRSVNSLSPAQQFAVIAFSEEAEVLGPPTLQRATPGVKRDLEKRLDALCAQGNNDDQLAPFQNAFEKAFALKPQLIFFLTDGAFDPRLSDVINRLNADHKVKISTLAFVKSDPRYELQLKDLAKYNGGIYKFVSEKDLGN